MNQKTMPIPTPIPNMTDTLPDLSPGSDLDASTVPLSVHACGATDRGRLRTANQDQFLVATFTGSLWVEQSSFPQPRVQCGGPQAHLFIVADGVGGNPGGEQASAIAVQAIQGFLVGALGWLQQLSGPAGILQELQSALTQADTSVSAATTGHPELHSMATTLTLACSVDDKLYIAHAGDSRCYLFRKGHLHQLTHDHTVVKALVDAGVIDEKAAESHSLRHVVTNIVGGGVAGVNAEVHKLTVSAGDVVLLCSDGLTEMLSKDEIATILQAEPEPARASERLVYAANEAGGRDNVTAVVARFDATRVEFAT